MDYDFYETFLTVAETKSFSRTAELLNVSQSTVTNRIKQLEMHIGKLLFIRDTRHVHLSEAGNVLFPFIKRGVEVLKEGELIAKSFPDFDEKLGIGCLISIWHYYLFPHIQTFKKRHLNYTIKLYSGHTKRIMQLLWDGIIEVCLVPTKPQHSDLDCTKIFEESFELVGNPEMVKDLSKSLTKEDIKNLPFIHIPWESPFEEWFQNEFGTKLFPSLETDDTTLYIRFLLEEKMIGFLPRSVSRSYIEKQELAVIPFIAENPLPVRPIYLVHHKKNTYSRALQDFKSIILSQIEKN